MRRVVGVLLVLATGCGRWGFDDRRAGTDDAGVADTPPDVALPDAPPAGNIVFITSTTHAAGTLGGLSGADAVCNARAAAAGLPGTYVAWISTSTVDARDRLAGSRGWRRPDGKPVTDLVSDLTSRRMFYPIDQDETGATVPPGTYVVTFTIGTGVHVSGYTSCNDLTSTTPDLWGASVGNGGFYWTSSAGYGAGSCGMAISRLYCFGVGENVAVSPPPITSRRAFWTTSGWTVGSGLAGADTACQDAANAGSLGGTFKALLATSTGSAFSRFDTTGPVWVRLDGVPIAASEAALLAGNLSAPLNLGPAGYGNGGDAAWIGAVSNQLDSPGTAATTCTDWSTTTGNGTYLVAGRHGQNAWFGISDPCTMAYSLICFEP